MKVILISSSSAAVGVSTHVLNLAILLKKNNMLDSVICPEEGWLTQQLNNYSIPYTVVYISFKPQRFFLSSYNIFKYIWSRKQVDIIHMHGRMPTFACILSMLILRNNKYFVTIHEFTNTSKQGLFKWKLILETLILRRLNGICCVSYALKDEITTRVGIKVQNKIKVIYNWIQPLKDLNIQHNVKRYNIKKNNKELIICAIGRLSYVKGLDILIEAINLLHIRGMKVKCDIFGDGPENEKISQLIIHYRLNNYITLKGQDGNVRSLLSRYKAIVIPSRAETFGIVALEAYESKLPIIASDIKGLNEVVFNNETGILCESENYVKFADAIYSVLNSEELSNRLTSNGINTLRKFSPNFNLVKQYILFYNF